MSSKDNLVDYLFDVTENVGDMATIVYVVGLGTVLSILEGLTVLPEWTEASDGTTQALFSLSDQFISAGQTSVTWAGAMALITAVAGLLITQGMDFFHPKNVRDASSFEEIFEWVAGVGTIAVPATIVFDIGGVKSTVTGDPIVGLSVFIVLASAYFWLVDQSRWE